MEDCCKPGKQGTNDNALKGGNMDIKRIIMWVVIAILIIAVVYVTFFKGGSSGNVISAGQAAGQVASSGMVGGC